MLKIALMTATAAVAITALAATTHTPRAMADIEDVLDTLEEFDDIAEEYEDCEYTIRKVKVKVWTRHGPRWVWVKRRVRDCD